MARKQFPDDAVHLRDFAKAACDAAKRLGIAKQVVADFPLDRPMRLLVARAPKIPAGLKKKLIAKQADFTVADAARMMVAVADSLPKVFSIKAVNLLLASRMLAASLEQALALPVRAEARNRKKAKSGGDIYQLKITLLGINPPIWRRIQVEDCTLDTLHEHIQTAMGWSNSHLHHFRFGEQLVGDPELMEENFDEFGYEDSTATKLSDAVPPSAKNSASGTSTISATRGNTKCWSRRYRRRIRRGSIRSASTASGPVRRTTSAEYGAIPTSSKRSATSRMSGMRRCWIGSAVRSIRKNSIRRSRPRRCGRGCRAGGSAVPSGVSSFARRTDSQVMEGIAFGTR